MQTRRDQLQAYRFQNRRALAALVTGEPNVLEPPMRRLTVTTLSGIMIAILIAAGFALVGVLKPSAGTSWKNPGAVIVDQDTNATYVYLDNTLHPVLNYTSAVLAVSGTGQVQRVTVSSSDISGATYGAEIGIPDVPYALPSASSLVGFPMAACSQEVPGDQGGVRVAVTLHVDEAGSTATSAGDSDGIAVPDDQGVLVSSAGDPTQRYLLYHGQRLAIGSADIGTALGLSGQGVTVGTAFLDALPLGPSLAPPRIRNANQPTGYQVAGATQTIGRVLETTDTHAFYLVLADGLGRLTAVEDEIVGGSQPPVPITDFQARQVTPSTEWEALRQPLDTLPADTLTTDSAATDRLGVCAVYPKDTDTPQLTLPPSALRDYPTVAGTPTESALSSAGKADRVLVPATHAVLARPADNSSTLVVIGDQGLQYSFASADLLESFGYKGVAPAEVPPQLLRLIPNGGPLDPNSARRTVNR